MVCYGANPSRLRQLFGLYGPVATGTHVDPVEASTELLAAGPTGGGGSRRKHPVRRNRGNLEGHEEAAIVLSADLQNGRAGSHLQVSSSCLVTYFPVAL